MEQLHLTPQLKLARISTPNLKTYLFIKFHYIPNKRMIWHNFHNCVSVAQYAISKNTSLHFTFWEIIKRYFASGVINNEHKNPNSQLLFKNAFAKLFWTRLSYRSKKLNGTNKCFRTSMIWEKCEIIVTPCDNHCEMGQHIEVVK